jgi:hypothetical protein
MKVYNMRKFLFFFVFLSLILTNCYKKENPEHYVISADFKKWVDFNEGSYWVYRNENSGVIDSCFIVHKEAVTYREYSDAGYFYDIILIILSRCTFFQSIAIQAEANFDWATIGLINGTEENSLRSDIQKGQRIAVGQGTYEVVDVLDSIQINNYYFRNVIHTRSTNNWTTGSIIHDYFFSKGIGLIRLHQELMDTDSTWNLLRWKTIQ